MVDFVIKLQKLHRTVYAEVVKAITEQSVCNTVMIHIIGIAGNYWALVSGQNPLFDQLHTNMVLLD